ncbi:MAG: PEP-CTERM sorting domain-containing protein, partial [Verrucomicrobia bacterium]|nr:PEP-CTERM sorting domain-containing protein [Verrucomicrobiota bacterium]
VGTGTAGLDYAILTGAGSIDVQTGILRLSSGASGTGTLSGPITVGAGATLQFAGATYNVNAGATYSGAGATSVTGSTVNFAVAPTFGSLSVSGGTINLNAGLAGNPAVTITSGAINFNAPATISGALSLSGGTLGGTGTVSLSGTGKNWTGGTMGGAGTTFILAGGTLAIPNTGNPALSGRSLANAGTVNFSPSSFVILTGAGGTLTNLSGGLWDFSNDRSFSVSGTWSFDNQAGATLRKSTTGGTLSFNLPLTNAGTIRSEAGTFSFTNTFTNNGGTLTAAGSNFSFSNPLNVGTGNIGGSGTFTASTVTAGGQVTPGTSAGLLTIAGNLTLLGTATSIFEIGGLTRGTQYDAIDVTGTATLAGSLQFSFLNGFNASVQGTDTFTLFSAGSLTGAFGNIASGARLGSADGAGSFQVDVSGTTLTLSQFILGPTTYIWSGGNLNTVGNITPSLLNASTVAAGDHLAISTGADHDFNATAIVNSGTVNWTGGNLQSGNGGSIINNAAFNDSTTSSVQVNSAHGGTTSTFTNAATGTYAKSGIGTTTFTVPFANSGAVNVTAGTLALNGGGTSSGTFAIGSGAAFNVGGDAYTLANGASLTGTGTFSVSGGTLSIAAGTLSLSNLTVNGGTLAGAGTAAIAGLNETSGVISIASLTLTGTPSWSGGTWSSATASTASIASGATLTISSGASHDYNFRAITNSGTVNWTGGNLQSGNGGAFINNAAFNDSATSSFQVNSAHGGTATFTNAATGTYAKSGASTTTFSGVTFDNSGAVLVSNGTLRFTTTFTQSAGMLAVANGATAQFDQTLNFAAGTLTGAGTVQATVNNSGLLSPGSSAGMLTVTGNLTLLGTSVLLIELGGTTQGTGHDFLSVGGSVALGGALNAKFIGGFESSAQSGDTFTILTAGGGFGATAFANVANGQTLFTVDGLGAFQVNYGSASAFTALTNSVVLSNFVAVPEPATWALMGIGAVVVLLNLRRRKLQP